jgi:hypothetical protein
MNEFAREVSMSKFVRPLLVTAWCCVLCCSCGPPPGRPQKTVFPVKGEVYVDGKPAAMLVVACANVQGMDKQMPTVSTAITNDDGKFEITTYKTGDGVPDGEYVLTFTWSGGRSLGGRGARGSADKLAGRYTDPKKSKNSFKVEGKPVDLGKIELTSK